MPCNLTPLSDHCKRLTNNAVRSGTDNSTKIKCDMPPVSTACLLMMVVVQDATRPVSASLLLSTGASDAVGDAFVSADVTPAIIADATALATNGSDTASAPRNASAQAAPTKQVTNVGAQVGTLARLMAAGGPPTRRRKRQTAESFSDSEVRCPTPHTC